MSSRVLSFTLGGSGGFAAEPAEPVLVGVVWCSGNTPTCEVLFVFGVFAVGVAVVVAEPAPASAGAVVVVGGVVVVGVATLVVVGVVLGGGGVAWVAGCVVVLGDVVCTS